MELSGRQILIVAGNYDVIHQVQQALQGEGVALKNAYSHHDALAALDTSKYDLALVDAAMFDRISGKTTIAALTEHEKTTPLLAYSATPDTHYYAQEYTHAIIPALDRTTILRGITKLFAPQLNEQDSIALPDQRGADTMPGRVEHLQTLFSLSKSLTEVLDLSAVLNRVVEAARSLTNADEGMILLPDDEDPDALYLRARVGVDIEAARNFRVKTDNNLAGEVYRTGKPRMVGARGMQRLRTEYFVQSLLYVPILLHGHPIGVLGVQNRQKDDLFDMRQQDLLNNLAWYAAIAIKNARDHEDSLQRARELETLVEASQIVNSSLSLEKTLPNICNQLQRVLNVSLVAICGWNAEKETARLLVGSTRARWSYDKGTTFDLRQLPDVYTATQAKQHHWATSPTYKPATPEGAALATFGAGAMLTIPIHVQGQYIGVTQLFYAHLPEIPPEAQIRKAHSATLEMLSYIVRQSGDNITQDLIPMADKLNKTVNADWSIVSLTRDSGATIHIQFAYGSGVWVNPPSPEIQVSQYPELLSVIKKRQTLNAQLGDETPDAAKPLLKRLNAQSILALPMIQRGQTYGYVFFIDTEHNHLFTRSEVDLAQAIIGQAATALENARLVTDLEQSLIDLKNAQERLINTARLSAMGELSAAVAHQINNPLTTILAESELLREDTKETPRQYQSVLAIHDAGKRAAGVVRRLLTHARADKAIARVEATDVVDSIRGVLSLVKSHMNRSRIQVVTHIPEIPLPPIYAAPGALDDIWQNLLINAHDALVGRPNPRVDLWVEYAPDDSQIKVLVQDNGTGIPSHILENIFKAFFTTKPPGQGTGLGLHICRDVVDSIGGSIKVENVPTGGARFTVCLPVKEEAVINEGLVL
jgi:signal transduction histidine kinase/CheY-like chemotaxis protein